MGSDNPTNFSYGGIDQFKHVNCDPEPLGRLRRNGLAIRRKRKKKR